MTPATITRIPTPNTELLSGSNPATVDSRRNPAAGGSSKRYFEGTHRVRAPEETWLQIAPFFPTIGITRVADVTGLDRLGIPVYQSVRPGSKNLSVSQGKGLTPAAARVSAVMESIEMWHAECLDHVPQVAVSLREMAYGNPIPADSLRWMTNTRLMRSYALRWVRAESMLTGRDGWLPRSMMELDFSAPRFFRPQMFVRNSNGLASGNTIDEAQLHGLCEVIERHAWYLAQVEPERLVAIDESSIESDPLRDLIGAVREAGLKLGIYDISWELGLPAAFVKLVASDLPVVWHGSGCHTSAEVAISRALTEAAQSRLTYIAGARDDLVGLAKGALAHRAFDRFDEPAPRRAFDDLPDLSTSQIATDVERVVGRLERLGYEPFWIDLTRAKIGIPVVSTFVPGLREMHG